MLRRLSAASKKCFSEFKKKMEPFQQCKIQQISTYYQDLCVFEKTLNSIELLKYEKALESIEKRINRFCSKSEKQYDFKAEITPMKTFQFFYKLQTNRYSPFKTKFQFREINLEELLLIVTETWENRINEYHNKIVNMIFAESSLKAAVEKRINFLEDHLCVNSFEGYQQLLEENNQEEIAGKKSALKQLDNKNYTFSKQYKFSLKETLSINDHEMISKICRMLTEFCACSEKVGIIAQKALMKGKNLNPQIINNYLYVLSWHLASLPFIELDLYKFANELQHQSFQLLFYMFVFKIEDYTIINRLIQSTHFQPKTSLDRYLQEQINRFLSRNFQMKIQSKDHSFAPESQAHLPFEEFLQYHQYEYRTVENSNIFPHKIYEIQGKKFICLNPSFFNKNKKVNGLGHLILKHFHDKSQSIKVLNPLKVAEMEKRGEKFQYYKSKMKGITKPFRVVEKKYDL